MIGEWLADRHPAGWGHLALDGKVVRGSRDGDIPGTHLLAADAPHAAAVVAQLRVGAATDEHKAALRLLGVLPPLGGAVVTADAMFTHADVCAAVRGRGATTSCTRRGTRRPSGTTWGRPSRPPRRGPFPPARPGGGG